MAPSFGWCCAWALVAGGGWVELSLARLRPGREYRLSGAVVDTFTAASDGVATVDIDLNERADIRLRPAV